MELPCKDKIPFKTQEEAYGAAVTAKLRYGGDRPKVYKCKYCQYWHLAKDYKED